MAKFLKLTNLLMKILIDVLFIKLRMKKWLIVIFNLLNLRNVLFNFK